MTDKQVAVVAGGSGGIGEGIVAALLDRGCTVYVPIRTGGSADRLKEYVENSPNLKTRQADLCDQGAVEQLRDTVLSSEGRLDAVVVSVGADYYGHRLHRMPREDWDRSVQDNLVTHFNTQRVFIDALRKQNSGVYVTMIGPEAESIRPDGGVMSIMAAAQKMMARVSAHEAFDADIRVHTLTAHTTISSRRGGADANDDWIASRDLGAYVAALIAGELPGFRDTRHELQDRAHVEALLGRARQGKR